MQLTGSRLECLEYFPETGDWVWRRPPNHNTRLLGKMAGSVRSDGYRRIRIGGTTYYASRLAFLWMLGRWPKNEVDHIDRDPSNDQWSNLREATSSENKFNQDNGYDGCRGIYRSSDKSWWAMAGRNYLGVFGSLAEAIAAREEALVEMGASAFAITDTSVLRNVT